MTVLPSRLSYTAVFIYSVDLDLIRLAPRPFLSLPFHISIQFKVDFNYKRQTGFRTHSTLNVLAVNWFLVLVAKTLFIVIFFLNYGILCL